MSNRQSGVQAQVEPPEQLYNVPPPQVSRTPIVVAIVGIAMSAMLSIVLLEVFTPKVETVIIVQIIGFATVMCGTVAALLQSTTNQAGIQQLHVAVNGRLSQLLDTTSKLQYTMGQQDALGASTTTTATTAATAASLAAAQLYIQTVADLSPPVGATPPPAPTPPGEVPHG